MFALVAALLAGSASAADLPETVRFASRDGRTQLTGYLFRPEGPGPHPAIVMLHGRAGPYSSAAKGRYDATTLSRRHLEWGRFWAARGYLGLHVDSFGPRGHAGGFPARSYRDRPAEVSDQTVRPLDAYGALAYLRTRADVIRDRIGVQGWSNGAMTALAALAADAPGIEGPTSATGFRAALVLYPGCGAQARQPYRPYAPMLMLLAGNDQEVSPAVCQELDREVRGRGGSLETVTYEGAVHAYDDPGPARQAAEANRRAAEDTRARAEAFFRAHLR